MKKQILLFTAIAGIGYLTLSSYDNGAALGGQNRSGAKSALTNCGGSGCHGTGTSTTVTLEVDTATTTTAVTAYTPGKLYTIKIHGTNTSSLPKFGFQFASVKGTGTSQTQAGTASSLPTNVASHASSGLNFIEHTAILPGTSAGVYDISFQWTAPAVGTGNVNLYCTLNAVDGFDNANAADISGNVFVVLTERTVSSSVGNISNNADVIAFPNPLTTNLNVQLNNAEPGAYSLQVFDINGRRIDNENIIIAGTTQTAKINTSNWPLGVYNVVLQRDSFRKTVSVVKR